MLSAPCQQWKKNPFISFKLRMASCRLSGNLYHRLWQAEKYLACFQRRYERGLPKHPCSPSAPLAFRYAHSNLFMQGSPAPPFCQWPYRQTGREHFTSSHTRARFWVVGGGLGEAQRDGSFRSVRRQNVLSQTHSEARSLARRYFFAGITVLMRYIIASLSLAETGFKMKKRRRCLHRGSPGKFEIERDTQYGL